LIYLDKITNLESCKGPTPYGQIGKIQNLHGFGGRINPHPSAGQGEILADLLNFTLIGATYRPCGAKNRKIGP